VALKESPGELIFDPTEFPNLTVSVVPAGTTTGCGAGAWGSAEEPAGLPPAASDEAAVLPAELEAVSAGLLEQAASVKHRKMDSTYNARERMIFTSTIKICRDQDCKSKWAECANTTGQFETGAESIIWSLCLPERPRRPPGLKPI